MLELFESKSDAIGWCHLFYKKKKKKSCDIYTFNRKL